MEKQKIELKVEGISCSHCVMSIENAVGALKGVSSVKVDLKNKKTKLEFDPEQISLEEIKEVIEDQGYEVK